MPTELMLAELPKTFFFSGLLRLPVFLGVWVSFLTLPGWAGRGIRSSSVEFSLSQSEVARLGGHGEHDDSKSIMSKAGVIV